MVAHLTVIQQSQVRNPAHARTSVADPHRKNADADPGKNLCADADPDPDADS